MDKAYDIIFKEEVDAVTVSNTSYRCYGNQFRYKCICCGEEVYLAAADSSEKSPHFRHRRGNNEKKCEEYLGQTNLFDRSISLKKHRMGNVSFYFNRDRMTFEVGVSFSDDELEACEREGRHFTMVSKYNAHPFLFVPISKQVFIPNCKRYFTITDFSTSYYVINEVGKYYSSYENVMSSSDKLCVYKSGNQNEHCRRQLDNIYTDIDYVGISECETAIQELMCLESAKCGEIFTFTSMKRNFFGVHFSVTMAEPAVEEFMRKHNYEIERAEDVCVLWPPVHKKNTDLVCFESDIYVYSSFDLIPHGNINKRDSMIEKEGEKIYKLAVDEEKELIIHEKNINVSIRKEENIISEVVPENIDIIRCDKFTVPDQLDYFVFDSTGCTKLACGSSVYLSTTDRIVGYENGHIRTLVYASPEETHDIREMLETIIKYHPQSEVFDLNDFMNISKDDEVLAYLESCYRSGQVNSVIKRYIKEGNL